jgi:hypothetical protein
MRLALSRLLRHLPPTLLLLLCAFSPLHAAPRQAEVKQPASSSAEVVVPAWPNPTCPVMGKPISSRLHTDTKYGRIYICCKSCVKDIQGDVDSYYKSSYPTTTKVENAICPVTGRALAGEGAPKEPVVVLLQGREFKVADKEAAALASDDAQATLAKLLDPKLVDVKNATCPVTGEAVAKNTIVVHDGRIVRLSSLRVLDEYKKDAAKSLGKALEIRARQDAAARAKEAAERAKGEGGKDGGVKKP